MAWNQSLLTITVQAEGTSMPDAKSQLMGIATVENDTIEIVEFSTPVSFRIRNRFAGRLANLKGATQVTADSQQLERELSVLFKKTNARAA